MFATRDVVYWASTPCLRNIRNLLIEFLRKLHFENVMEMVTECLRLQEIGVDLKRNSCGCPMSV